MGTAALTIAPTTVVEAGVKANGVVITVNLTGDTWVGTKTDDFNRADGGLGSAWTTQPGSDGTLGIVSNHMKGDTVNSDASAYRNDVTPGDDQYSRIVVGDPTGIAAFARMQTGSESGYRFYRSSSSANVRLIEVDNGTETVIAANTPLTLSAGDLMEIRCVGSTIQGWVYQSGSWTKVREATSQTKWTSGRVGANVYSDVGTINAWEGGSL